MTPNIEILQEWMKLLGAAATLTGAMAGFWRKDGPKEDEIVIEAIDTLIEGLSDANKIAKIEQATGKNMRDQWNVDDVVAWSDERNMRSWKDRN